MPEAWFAVPGDLNTLTGGYVYARRLIAALRDAGWNIHHAQLPGGFPNPSPHELAETRHAFQAIPAKSTVIVDGLAFGALTPDIIAGVDLTITALVHHPLALETGTSPARAAELRASERTMLALARSVVVTSGTTARTLTDDFAVSKDRITVAEPGTDPALRAAGSGDPPCLLTVASVTPRKGYDLLIEALAALKDLRWRGIVVGSLTRDSASAEKTCALIARYSLGDHIAFKGELADGALDAAYHAADIFVLPSRYEGYGMAFTEALAHGLPVVACAAGAVVDTVPAAAGLLVPPDDTHALSAALRRLLEDATLRKRLSDAAWAYAQKLPRWHDTAAIVARTLTP